MVPDEFRTDGWPLCPVCGEDELADLVCRERNLSLADLKTDDLASWIAKVAFSEAFSKIGIK